MAVLNEFLQMAESGQGQVIGVVYDASEMDVSLPIAFCR